MQFFTVSLWLFSVALPVFGNHRKGTKSEFPMRAQEESVEEFPFRDRSFWEKRPLAYEIPECVFVTSEENRYFYKATSDSEDVCGFYIFTDSDKIIEITFEYLNVPCENGGLVSFVDGWELNGQFFPGIHDHEKPFAERYREFCGVKKIKPAFLTSQNAGMLHYRLPTQGTGFGFRVRFLKTPTPCNILVENQMGVYTLKNYGRAVNCSLMAVFPAKVKILALNVGMLSPRMTIEAETGTIHQCGKKRKGDFLQIGGSEGLDSSHLVPFDEICGVDSSPEIGNMVIGCGVTGVKLFSSGGYDNSATFTVSPAREEDFSESSFICQL